MHRNTEDLKIKYFRGEIEADILLDCHTFCEVK